MKKTKFLKHVLRIIFAIPLSILALRFSDFKSIINMLMFMVIYVLVGIVIEFVFDKFKNKKSIN